MEVPAEVRIILEEVLWEWGQQTDDKGMREEMLEDLYERLGVAMFAEILTHLRGKHLAAFVRMNQEKILREEIYTFLQENMRTRSLPVRLPNFENFMASRRSQDTIEQVV
jgi:hypothetical protein